MEDAKDVTINANLKRGIKSCLVATLISGVFFSIVFQQFTIEGIGYTFLLDSFKTALILASSPLLNILSIF